MAALFVVMLSLELYSKSFCDSLLLLYAFAYVSLYLICISLLLICVSLWSFYFFVVILHLFEVVFFWGEVVTMRGRVTYMRSRFVSSVIFFVSCSALPLSPLTLWHIDVNCDAAAQLDIQCNYQRRCISLTFTADISCRTWGSYWTQETSSLRV